jgi:hypothetical protein
MQCKRLNGIEILYYFKEKDALMDDWQFDELKKHNCNITVYKLLKCFEIYGNNKKLCSFIKEN